jgi:hypothetical protein
MHLYRTQQYVHHWEDVLFGSLLGYLVAYLVFGSYYHTHLSPYVYEEAEGPAYYPRGVEGEGEDAEGGRLALPRGEEEQLGDPANLV